MERLWAPWRMSYILNSRQPGCFMCDLLQAEQDEKNMVLKRGETCALLLNRYPYNNGHLMAAPYRHVGDFAGMTPAERCEMTELAGLACSILRKTHQPDGFNIGINIGAAAGAGLVDHVHMHVVPRWEGDTNFLAVLGGVKVIPQPLDELWRQLREALKSL